MCVFPRVSSLIISFTLFLYVSSECDEPLYPIIDEKAFRDNVNIKIENRINFLDKYIVFNLVWIVFFFIKFLLNILFHRIGRWLRASLIFYQ